MDRGFAYSYDGTLDMRMDGHDDRTSIPASVIVNTFPVEKITEIIEMVSGHIISRHMEHRKAFLRLLSNASMARSGMPIG